MNVEETKFKLKDLCALKQREQTREIINLNVNDIICLLCDDIVQSPPVRCNQCESLYCNECADMLKMKKKKCLDNKNISPSHVLTGFKQDDNLEEILKNNLLFKCGMCPYTTREVTEISFHLLDCNSISIQKSCPNQNCEFTGSDLEVEKHELECKYFLIKCGVCGFKLHSHEEQKQHNCMNKIVEDLTSMEEMLVSEEQRFVNYIKERKGYIETIAKKYEISLLYCKLCKGSLHWLSNQSKISGKGYFMCNSINKDCNGNFRFYCEICKIVFCTVCVKIQPSNICFCGKNMKIKTLVGHFCDICRASVNSAWRCDECDYDICTINCLKEEENGLNLHESKV